MRRKLSAVIAMRVFFMRCSLVGAADALVYSKNCRERFSFIRRDALPPLRDMQKHVHPDLFPISFRWADREFRLRRVLPVGPAIPASRDSKPQPEWLRVS